MTKFCKKHIVLRTQAELEQRKDIILNGKITPGLQAELLRIKDRLKWFGDQKTIMKPEQKN